MFNSSDGRRTSNAGGGQSYRNHSSKYYNRNTIIIAQILPVLSCSTSTRYVFVRAGAYVATR